MAAAAWSVSRECPLPQVCSDGGDRNTRVREKRGPQCQQAKGNLFLGHLDRAAGMPVLATETTSSTEVLRARHGSQFEDD